MHYTSGVDLVILSLGSYHALATPSPKIISKPKNCRTNFNKIFTIQALYTWKGFSYTFIMIWSCPGHALATPWPHPHQKYFPNSKTAGPISTEFSPKMPYPCSGFSYIFILIWPRPGHTLTKSMFQTQKLLDQFQLNFHHRCLTPP